MISLQNGRFNHNMFFKSFLINTYLIALFIRRNGYVVWRDAFPTPKSFDDNRWVSKIISKRNLLVFVTTTQFYD